MPRFALIENLQSSEFRSKHRKLIRVRLLTVAIFLGLSALLYSYGFLLNLPLIVGAFVACLVVDGLSEVALRLEKAEGLLFLVGLVLDVLALSLLVVSATGDRTPLLTLYILYVLAIGLFFGSRTAILPAVLGFFLFIGGSILLTPGSPLLLINLRDLLVDAIWLLILLVTVGIISVNHARSVWDRERVLAHRERELGALQNISSATRKDLPLEGVIRLVLTELVLGLRFDFGFLLLLESDSARIRLYHAHTGKNDDLVDRVLGFPLSSVHLPTTAVANSFFRAIRRKRTILHYKLSELTIGLEPQISSEKAQEFQDQSGLRIFVGVPMIAERQVIGALVAGTRKADLPKGQIVSLQKYANQAGLAIESAARFEEIERKNQALEKANRAKSDFLATMSHELRTPLTAIIGFSELILQDFMGVVNEEQRDGVQEILNNAENLLVLINRILDFEKIEAGKAVLELEDYDLRTCMERVERSTASLRKRKSLAFSLEILSDLPALYGDERKIRQVLLNLISNAIKFTPEGGAILLRAEVLGTAGDGQRVSVSVQDTGIGIQPKDLQTVFEPFEQVDSSTTREYEGTGLGLALSKRFIEIQGGQIGVESRFGEGSTFTFEIPVRVKDPTRKTSSAA